MSPDESDVLARAHECPWPTWTLLLDYRAVFGASIEELSEGPVAAEKVGRDREQCPLYRTMKLRRKVLRDRSYTIKALNRGLTIEIDANLCYVIRATSGRTLDVPNQTSLFDEKPETISRLLGCRGGRRRGWGCGANGSGRQSGGGTRRRWCHRSDILHISCMPPGRVRRSRLLPR